MYTIYIYNYTCIYALCIHTYDHVFDTAFAEKFDGKFLALVCISVHCMFLQ